MSTWIISCQYKSHDFCQGRRKEEICVPTLGPFTSQPSVLQHMFLFVEVHCVRQPVHLECVISAHQSTKKDHALCLKVSTQKYSALHVLSYVHRQVRTHIVVWMIPKGSFTLAAGGSENRQMSDSFSAPQLYNKINSKTCTYAKAVMRYFAGVATFTWAGEFNR